MADDPGKSPKNIINNVPELMKSMGGLSDAVAIARVAAHLLISNWDQLSELFPGPEPSES